MSYLVQSQMVNDRFIIERAGACAAGVGIAGGLQWAARHALDLVVSPGWVEAYTDAGGLPDGDPAGFTLTLGARPDVITDQMILDAVCRLAGIPLPAEPEPAPEPETAPEPEPEPEDEPEDEVEPAPPELPHTDGDTPVTDTESPA